ncbi:hypothetical protein [Caballeronia sp. DA-9]|uniref:hypothetical protein n=1 Tax=Caballeronia sp. DA-9 TaxID=3436237 RepID=UPI003F67D101
MRKISETKAFDLSIAAIRTAQGKGNPEDFATGTPEWQSAQLGVMQDTLRIIDMLRTERKAALRRTTDKPYVARKERARK